MKQNETNATEFRFWRNESNGMLEWKNARTLERYKEIENEHPDPANYNCFFAFGNKQFAEGIAALRKKLDNPDLKVVAGGNGVYGTPDGVRAFFRFYEQRIERIAKECDPQEVYCCEFNNYECCFAIDGDWDAIRFIINTFGADAARKVVRFDNCHTVDSIIKTEAE